MSSRRQLLVIADDFGIGPETSRGILELAQHGRVTGTVLLVNSPYAAESVARWRAVGRPVELGWHPNLTLDRPVAGMRSVPSLVSGSGTFFSLGSFLTRLLLGQIRAGDIATELKAQWQRFTDLVGQPPALVASHQHIGVFAPVEQVLRGLLAESGRPAYLRTVTEPWRVWAQVPGRRLSRLLLTLLGRRWVGRTRAAGLATADALLGLAAGARSRDTDAFFRVLLTCPSQRAEFLCHPGRLDETLRGRDAWRAVRPQELELLQGDRLDMACRAAGWTLTRPSQVCGPQESGRAAA